MSIEGKLFRGWLTLALFLGLASQCVGDGRLGANAGNLKPSLREARFERLGGGILSLDIAPNSDLAAAGLSGCRVRVWRLDSAETAHEFIFPEPETDPRQKFDNEVEPLRVRFAPDGRTLAVSHLSRIYLYEVGSWREIRSLGVAGEETMRRRPSPELTRRPPPDKDHEEKPAPTLNQVFQDWFKMKAQGDGRTRITDFKFTADGSSILAAYCGGGCYDIPGDRRGPFATGKDPVRFWDVSSARLIWERVLDPKQAPERVVPSPDGKWFAAASNSFGVCAVGIYDLHDGHRVASLPQVYFPREAPTLLFTPDSHYLITFRAEKGTPKFRHWQFLAVYEVSSGRMTEKLSERQPVRSADASADGRWLATTNWRGLRFLVWDLQTRQPVLMEAPKEWIWRGPIIDRVRFSPDGRRLVVAADTVGMLAVYQFQP
jgi:WD40 repeat protein